MDPLTMPFPFPPRRAAGEPMRVLVTGAGGMLGHEVVHAVETMGHESVGVTRAEFDISDPMSIARLMTGELGQIDAVINAAAYTAVDRAEEEEREATEVNGLGVAYLARACQQIQADLIHVSTDFVFEGTSTVPYDEESIPNPQTAYGRSKLQGERALAGNPIARIVRTAWLFGPVGKCFPSTILAAHRTGKSLRVVADQFGNPTYVPDLARVLVQIAERNLAPGIYHATGRETTTWHDFAVRAIEAATGEKPSIEPVTTDQYPTAARRPSFSALADTKLQSSGILPMRSLYEALNDWAARLTL